MKSVFFFILLSAAITSSAQTIEYYDYNWNPTEVKYARFYSIAQKKDSLWQRQDFFIHDQKLQMSGFFKDQQTKIEHGKFYYFYPNGQVQSVGSYHNGKRQGVWIRYHPNGMISDSATYWAGNIMGLRMGWHPNGFISDSSITYADGSGVQVAWFDNGSLSVAGLLSAGGKQTGKWKYFHKNGQLSSEEVYANGVLRSKQYYDEKGIALTDTTSRDREAEFPGGEKKLEKFVYSRMYFPDQYKITNSDQAVVVVNWVINEEGGVEDVHISVPFHPDFDRIVSDAVRKMPRWNPEISHNRKVKAYIKQSVTFVQKEE